MFHTDKKTLEDLSFHLQPSDVANFKAHLEYLLSHNLFTIPASEVQKGINALDEIGKLQLSGQIYAFHVNDAFAEKQQNNSIGVELYRRQGDMLQTVFGCFTRDVVYLPEEATEWLKKERITRVYTCKIPYQSDFLGIPSVCDDEDPFSRDILDDDDIDQFQADGIEVVVLQSLL